jgi:DNA/RNA endonuclease YhcR with UshA esterase domain
LELQFGSICETEGSFRILGEVSQVESTQKMTSFTIERVTPISVVVFDPDVSVSEGDIVAITGRLDEYRGKKQFIAESIRRVE